MGEPHPDPDISVTIHPCGHPWSAAVQLDPETVRCGACIMERLQRFSQREDDWEADDG